MIGAISSGASSFPEYEGSSGMTVVPLIADALHWGNNHYRDWDGIAGRINILNNERFEFGPGINITLGRDEDFESLKRRRLGEIDTADTHISIRPAGTKDFSFGVTANYDLTDRWSLFAMTKYSRLLGDFADSPIVALEGDDNQFSVGLGIGWKF
jgi:MltA-interacting protein MipA